AQSWKLAIGDPDLAIAAIKKRDPLIDEKVERRRLDLVIKYAVLTEHVRREGLSAVEPDRMKQTIEMVAKTFNIPALDPASVYRSDFLPPRSELKMYLLTIIQRSAARRYRDNPTGARTHPM